jgi:hypothetical protein
LAEEAKQAWLDGLNTHTRRYYERGLAGDMQSVWSKFRVQAARLVIVLHAMHIASRDEMNLQETRVSADCIQSAWNLAEYYLQTAAYVFEKIQSSRQSSAPRVAAHKLFEKIVQYAPGPEGFECTALHQRVKRTTGLGTAAEFRAALTQLCLQGRAEMLAGNKRARLVQSRK